MHRVFLTSLTTNIRESLAMSLLMLTRHPEEQSVFQGSLTFTRTIRSGSHSLPSSVSELSFHQDQLTRSTSSESNLFQVSQSATLPRYHTDMLSGLSDRRLTLYSTPDFSMSVRKLKVQPTTTTALLLLHTQRTSRTT